MVFERFGGVFFSSNFVFSLEGEFVKKLTKPRPWRQNQESTFLKFIKKFGKKTLKITIFFELRFWMYFSSILGGFGDLKIDDFLYLSSIFWM